MSIVPNYRGLHFTCIALRRSQEDHSEELTDSFTKAYEQSLKKYHSIVVRPLFAVSVCLLRDPHHTESLRRTLI
jgi:hypothetical protein